MVNYYIYPAIFRQKENQVVILFPDFDGILSAATDMKDAPYQAKEALGLHLVGCEEENEPIPEPTRIGDIKLQNNEIAFMVEVYMPSFRSKVKTAFVKKTLSIPAYLNVLGEKNNINFSKVLQEALINLNLK